MTELTRQTPRQANEIWFMLPPIGYRESRKMQLALDLRYPRSMGSLLTLEQRGRQQRHPLLCEHERGAQCGAMLAIRQRFKVSNSLTASIF